MNSSIIAQSEPASQRTTIVLPIKCTRYPAGMEARRNRHFASVHLSISAKAQQRLFSINLLYDIYLSRFRLSKIDPEVCYIMLPASTGRFPSEKIRLTHQSATPSVTLALNLFKPTN